MNQSTNPQNLVKRLHVVDALRGFAVIAILLVHSVEHFIYPVYPDLTSQPEWLNVLDKGVFTVTFGLFAGKAYAIFALLFGLTFHIQFTSAQKRGEDFGWRFIWRLLLLILFASLNAAFFPGGDVLLLFVFVGPVLVFVRHLNNKAILLISLFFLFQPIEWVHYLMSLANDAYSLPNLRIGPLYKEVIEAAKTGEWLPFLKANLWTGQKASLFWAIGAGRYFQTAGLFLLGLWLGRKKYFEDTAENRQFWIRTLMMAAVVFGPLYMLKVDLYDTIDDTMIKRTVGVVFDMWQKLAFTFVLVSSFVIAYQHQAIQKRSRHLRNYGKMSLTNYVSQSIIGALVFFPIGLNLAPYTGYTLSFLIGILICLLQIQFCNWWLKKHSHGPLEGLWKKATWIGSTKR
ncbi:DUF418 domain-containing protein [Lutimonas sp.]|uniref:DUF418 domain-containing protein n=1 Tax=Lutimonas sp. TaxID=1872403 RepID=UPI003D9B81A1